MQFSESNQKNLIFAIYTRRVRRRAGIHSRSHNPIHEISGRNIPQDVKRRIRMSIKILTLVIAGIITLGGTTGIVAATNPVSEDSIEPTISESVTDETTADPTVVETTAAETTAAETTAAETTAVETTVPAVTETEPTAAPVTEPIVVVEPEPTAAPITEPIVVVEPEPTTEPVIVPEDVLLDGEEIKTLVLNFAGATALLVDVELTEENAVPIYVVTLKTDAGQIILTIDGNTGVILSSAIDTDDMDDNDECDKLNENRKNDEAHFDNEARKACDGTWDGQTRKNDEAKRDNEARKDCGLEMSENDSEDDNDD